MANGVRGSSRGVLLLTVLAVGLFAGAIWYWKPWEQLGLGLTADLVTPSLDAAHARQALIPAAEGGSITVIDSAKVHITLEIPPGALEDDAIVQLIPFFPDPEASYPTSGAMVSPGTLDFTRPATLTFAIAGARKYTDAPGNFTLERTRLTGPSQVLLLDSKADTLTPTLVVRPTEISSVIPARIASGGAYVWSIDTTNAVELARIALQAERSHPLVALEAGSRILASSKLLSKQELVSVERAVKGTLAADSPGDPELYAAAALQTLQNVGQARTFFTPAYAADPNRGYFEARCKDRSLSLNDFLTAAQTAQLMGYEDLGEACLVVAKTIVAAEAEDLLARLNPHPVALLIQLQRVQIIGLDEDSPLDDRLYKRVQHEVSERARAVLVQPDATAIDVAKALQEVQGIGADDAEIEAELGAKLEQLGTVGIEPLKLGAEHPDLVPGFDAAVIGLPLAQFLGLASFDQAGIRVFTDEWFAKEDKFTELAGALCSLPAALGVPPPPQCAAAAAELTAAFAGLEKAGYRAADEVGQIQDQEFEEPEYDNTTITVDCDALSPEERRALDCPEEEAMSDDEPASTSTETDGGTESGSTGESSTESAEASSEKED